MSGILPIRLIDGEWSHHASVDVATLHGLLLTQEKLNEVIEALNAHVGDRADVDVDPQPVGEPWWVARCEAEDSIDVLTAESVYAARTRWLMMHSDFDPEARVLFEGPFAERPVPCR